MDYEKQHGSEELRLAPYRRFGAQLRELRVTSGHALPDEESVGESNTGGQQPLLIHLRSAGFPMDVATYREIEAGRRLPFDAGRFVDAVAVFLRLSTSERVLLLDLLAVEILTEAMGCALTREVLAGRLRAVLGESVGPDRPVGE